MRFLEHKNPLLRKGAAVALQLAKRPALLVASGDARSRRPPVVVNSLPKSGTHLLLQMARAIPHTRYLGGFVAHAWSVTLRERPPAAIRRRLARLLAGEVVGAHIRHHPDTAAWFRIHPAIHLFIHRDPRDVVLSEEAYLTGMAPWHRLHRVLRRVPDREERLRLLIEGIPGIYPDIGARVRGFTAWLEEEGVIGVRYEDLQGPDRRQAIHRIAERIVARAPAYGPVAELAERMERAIDPQRSHTFREGGTEKWRRRLSADLLRRIMDLAGDEIRRLGYPVA